MRRKGSKVRRWTEEEVSFLKSAIDRNIPYEDVAKQLKRSYSAVSNKAYVLGITRPRGFQTGHLNPRWKGGRRITNYGYIEVYMPEHHRARTTGYVFEHIIVAEKKIGRRIQPSESVHHINGNKQDNSPKNLAVIPRSIHSRIHAPKKSGRHIACPVCGSEFYAKPVEIRESLRITCSRACANRLRARRAVT